MHFSSNLGKQSNQATVFFQRSDHRKAKLVVTFVNILKAEVIEAQAFTLEQIKQMRQGLGRSVVFRR